MRYINKLSFKLFTNDYYRLLLLYCTTSSKFARFIIPCDPLETHYNYQSLVRHRVNQHSARFLEFLLTQSSRYYTTGLFYNIIRRVSL